MNRHTRLRRLGWLSIAGLMVAGLLSITQAGPATAQPTPSKATGECWIEDIGRIPSGAQNGTGSWPQDHSGSVRLQSCLYKDGTNVWAKTRLIGRAWTKMYGLISIGIQRCNDPKRAVLGHNTVGWDGRDDRHYDHGAQQYGSTYYSNVWTHKVPRDRRYAVRIRVQVSGMVVAAGGQPQWGLSANGINVPAPYGEYRYAPSAGLPWPSNCRYM